MLLIDSANSPAPAAPPKLELVALVRLPEASPREMLVTPRFRINFRPVLLSDEPEVIVAKTKIFELVDFGVMEAVKPVRAVVEPVVKDALNVSVLVVLTTCSTVPYG